MTESSHSIEFIWIKVHNILKFTFQPIEMPVLIVIYSSIGSLTAAAYL